MVRSKAYLKQVLKKKKYALTVWNVLIVQSICRNDVLSCWWELMRRLSNEQGSHVSGETGLLLVLPVEWRIPSEDTSKIRPSFFQRKVSGDKALINCLMQVFLNCVFVCFVFRLPVNLLLHPQISLTWVPAFRRLGPPWEKSAPWMLNFQT